MLDLTSSLSSFWACAFSAAYLAISDFLSFLSFLGASGMTSVLVISPFSFFPVIFSCLSASSLPDDFLFSIVVSPLAETCGIPSTGAFPANFSVEAASAKAFVASELFSSFFSYAFEASSFLAGVASAGLTLPPSDFFILSAGYISTRPSEWLLIPSEMSSWS